MKKAECKIMKILLSLSFLLLIGCTKHQDRESPPEPVYSSAPALGAAPQFNVNTPEGYTKTVFHGKMPSDGVVQIPANSDMLVDVFIKFPTINQWFIISDRYSSGYWYQIDKTSGIVHYQGNYLSGKEYCVYQYLPIE